LKISVKLIVGFLVVAFMACLIGVMGVISLDDVTDSSEYLYSYATVPIKQVSSALNLYQENRVDTRNLLFMETDEKIEETIDNMKARLEEIEAIMAEYEKTIATETGRGYYNNFVSAYNVYLPILNEIIELVQDGKKEEAVAVLYGDGMADAAKAVQDGLQGLIDTRTKNGQLRYEDVLSVSVRTKTTMIALSVFGGALAVILGLAISKTISRPINHMVEIADKLALGDIDVNIEAEHKDETGQLANAFKTLANAIRDQTRLAERMAEGDFSMEVDIRSEKDILGKALNEMIKRINELMGDVTIAAEQVATGAKQISNSSMVLSEGSTEQASSIEELTASLEELSSQTAHNAENAGKANELTKAVKTKADQGNKQMKEMLNAMTEINASSNNINKIIKVID